MIKAGIAGLGWWGQNLVNSVQGKSETINFTAGAVRHPDKVADFAEEQGLALFDSYEAMLADGDIDAVVLATPHSIHADQMVAAAAAGKHIYSEKPFTMSKADAEHAVAAANAAGVQVVVGHNRRFHPAMAELRIRLADGSLGTPLHVEATESVPAGIMLPPDNWRFDRAEWPAGGMTPMGIHLIDGMVDLFGTVASVYCQSVNRVVEADIDDTTSVLLQFDSGMTGYIAVMVAARPNLRFSVHGTAAQFTMSPRSYNHAEILPFEGEPENIDFGDYNIEGDALNAELEAFAAAVEGRAPYPIPQDQIIHVVAVLEAIIKSAETKAPVQIA
jgi:predicted dehydrogenase